MQGDYSLAILVLCGDQGIGKTNFFRNLLPAELRSYYGESKLDAGKDDEILMCKKIILCDDEFGGKSKQEEETQRTILQANFQHPQALRTGPRGLEPLCGPLRDFQRRGSHQRPDGEPTDPAHRGRKH